MTTGQQRSVLVVILLSIITCGIYGIYWQYVVFKEMKDHSGSGIGGGLALVFAILTGGLVNVFLMPSEVGELYERTGQAAPVRLATGFWVFLPLLGGLIWIIKTQGALNAYWSRASGTAATAT